MRKETSFINIEKFIELKQRSSSFISKREELHKLIRRTIKKLKFDQNTLHLSLFYLDIIMLNNNHIKMDLAAITCLFIAGNNILFIF